jgi:hypothetical protein
MALRPSVQDNDFDAGWRGGLLLARMMYNGQFFAEIYPQKFQAQRTSTMEGGSSVESQF